jgi:hypothetical protein
MRFFLPLLMLVGVVALVGCDTGEVVTPETTTNSVTDIMRPILERVAETGELQPAEELKSYIEEDLAGVDPAKSEALMADYQELMSLSSQDEIKAKAQDMISKL